MYNIYLLENIVETPKRLLGIMSFAARITKKKKWLKGTVHPKTAVKQNIKRFHVTQLIIVMKKSLDDPRSKVHLKNTLFTTLFKMKYSL